MAFTTARFMILSSWLALNALMFVPKVLSIRQLNFYQKYFIEDICTTNQSVIYILDGEGLFSAAKISASRLPWYGNNRNCTVFVQPPLFHGVILTVDSMSLGYSSAMYGCTDYLQAIAVDGNSTKFCGQIAFGNSLSFSSDGGMKLVYHTSNSEAYFRGTGFTVVVTSYSCGNAFRDEETFKCRNGKYIWENFACDGINNCGDNSDEVWEETSHCHDVPEFTAKPVDFNWDLLQPTFVTSMNERPISAVSTAIFCVVFIMMTVVLRFYCYRCNQRQDRAVMRQLSAIRNMATRYRFNTSDQGPPPPYSILVGDPNNEQATAVTEDPPPYTVAIPETEGQDKDPSGSEDHTTSGDSETKDEKPDQAPPYIP